MFKAGSLGISLRRPLHEQQAAEKQEAKAASTAAQNDATYEDYIFNEKDLDYYWREFAAALPKEEKANSARMMNMHPHLLNDTTFEVTVDNDMVEKYMVQLIPSVQNHLRERLHVRSQRNGSSLGRNPDWPVVVAVPLGVKIQRIHLSGIGFRFHDYFAD